MSPATTDPDTVDAPESTAVSEPHSPDAASAPRRAYIHIGAPKTGSTYLQGVLWRNKEALREAGLHVLGENRGDHYRAGSDLRDMPFDPNDPRLDWTGAWDIICSMAAHSSAPSVIVSDEHLASLSDDQVRRAVEGLAPREVHIVYAARGLAGLLPSEWQEYVKHGSKLDYATWTTRVLTTPKRGPGRWFWKVHDPAGVVRRFGSHVPLERIHVITMPPPSAGPDELWHRFAGVLRVDPAVATDFDVAGNTSLGWTETEVLRRVNQALPEEFPRWHYIALTRDLLAVKVLSEHSSKGKPSLPEELQEVMARRERRIMKGLTSSGCDIVGDVGELAPPSSSRAASPEPTAEEIGDTAVDAVAGLLVHMARRRDTQRANAHGMRDRLQADPKVRRLRGRLISWSERNRVVSAATRRLRAN